MRLRRLANDSLNAGYTLVEILLVTAMLGASFLAWAQLTNNYNSFTKTLDNQVSRDALSNLVRETLKYSNTCQKALVGLNETGFDETAILSGNKTVNMLMPGIFNDLTPNDDILTTGAMFKGLEIEDIKLVNAVRVPGAVEKYFAEMRIKAKPVGGVGVSLRNVDAGGFYFTVNAGRINGCISQLASSFPLCQEMGCEWDPTATPACQCLSIDLNLSCPPQQYATGIDSNGQPICTPLGGPPCGPNYYLKGVGIGTSECAPLPSLPAAAPAAVPGPAPATPPPDACGPAHGQVWADAATATAQGLCASGTPNIPSLVGYTSPWNWQCGALWCNASEGKCGPANNGTFASATDVAAAGLCENGTAGSVVEAASSWWWGCSGHFCGASKTAAATPTTCPAMPLNWEIGCTASVPASPVGYTDAAVTNTTAGLVGTLTATCTANGTWQFSSKWCLDLSNPLPVPPPDNCACPGLMAGSLSCYCFNGAGVQVGGWKDATVAQCSMRVFSADAIAGVYGWSGYSSLCPYP